MADGDNGPGEGFQIVLQHRHGGDIQIIGGFVQQQHIGGRGQNPQQEQPPLFTAGNPADQPVLHGPGEQEFVHKSGGRQGPFRGLNPVSLLFHIVQSRLVGVQFPGVLGKIPQLYRVAHSDGALVRLKAPGNQIQKRGFARAVAADNAHPVCALQQKIKVPQHPSVPEALARVLQFHGFSAQAGRKSLYALQALLHFRGLGSFQSLVPFQPFPAFGTPGAGALQHPLKLPAQNRPPLAL